MKTISAQELALMEKIKELRAAIQYGFDELSGIKPGSMTRQLVDIRSRLRKALK